MAFEKRIKGAEHDAIGFHEFLFLLLYRSRIFTSITIKHLILLIMIIEDQYLYYNNTKYIMASVR